MSDEEFGDKKELGWFASWVIEGGFAGCAWLLVGSVLLVVLFIVVRFVRWAWFQ